MRKTLAVLGVILAVLLVACATNSGSTAGTGKVTAENAIEESFQNVYNRYKGDLILDGAASYTVKRGDTLHDISQSFYKSGFYYPVIMLASSDVVLDPDKIEPDMKLMVPDLQKNLNDAKAKSSIKKFLVEIAKIEEDRKRSDTAVGMRKLSDTL